MIKINLLPVKAAKKKERIMTQFYVGIIILTLAVVSLGYHYYSQYLKIKEVETEITKTDVKIADLREAKKAFDELKKKKLRLENQLAAIEKLDLGRNWFIRVLDKISESVPRNQVWITSLKYGGGKGRKGGGANSLSIKGKSYDRDAIAHFMGNLSIIPCDDALPDMEKTEICRIRNDSCRSWSEEKKNWEWNFEKCRRFYKNIERKSNSCIEDVKNCEATRRAVCQNKPKGNKCKEAKQRCETLKSDCDQDKRDIKKLLEEQYIVYNNVKLKYVKSGKVAKKGVFIYDFEIVVNAAPTPKK